MSFVIIEKSMFPIEHCFNGLVIQGGLRRTIFLVSFGMKFDIMFKKGLTCQLGNVKVLTPRKTGHAPFNGR